MFKSKLQSGPWPSFDQEAKEQDALNLFKDTQMSTRALFWLAVIVGVASAVSAVWAVWHFEFGALAFVSDVPTAAIKVVTSLVILTLLIERSLAVINAAVFGEEKRKQEDALRKVKFDFEVDLQAGKDPGDVKRDAGCALKALREIADKEEKVRIVIAVPVAFFLSAVGVRTLSALMMIDGVPEGIQKQALLGADIVLTAGLIAGGSHGLAQLLKLINDALKPKSL